jgi:pimeloyl-ACP methyl ester carboxylesterase
LGALLASCGSGTRAIEGYENLPGGNPLVPEVAALPYPADFYLVEDASTATGRRLALPQEVMPRSVDATLFQQDGFTVIPAILAYLPGGTDVASLPSPTDHAASIADDSSVLLVREDTWERVGVLAELDQTTDDTSRQAIIIRPLRALEYNTGYVVILRDSLRRLDGTAHEPSEVYAALRDRARTGIDEIDRQRDSFGLVRAAIDGAGLDQDEVVLAWSFHTRSEAPVVTPLVSMQIAANEAPIGAYEITRNEVDGTNRQIEGTMEVPNFVDPDTADVVLNAAGEATQVGVRTVPFVLTVPETIDEARPVIIYGHGFLGTRAQTTRGSFNDLCQDYRMSAAGVEFGFHENVVPIVSRAFGGDWVAMNEVVAEVEQSFVNSTFLARLIRERLADELTHDPMDGSGPHALLDADNVHYMGISNGGTFGYVMAATSPQLERAVMVVGGGGLIHFLTRATQWNSFGPLLNLVIRDPLDQQLAFAMIQQVLDPVDAMNYMRHLVDDRFPGMRPLRASMHMAVNDSQVNNLVTEWAMRTADIPMVVPSPRDVWDLPTVSAPEPLGAPADVLAAMHVYDEHVTPSPVTNVPPAADNDTHGTVRELPSYQIQVGRFLTEGIFVHACDGACDPN